MKDHGQQKESAADSAAPTEIVPETAQSPQTAPAAPKPRKTRAKQDSPAKGQKDAETAPQKGEAESIGSKGTSKKNDEFLQLRSDWLKILHEDMDVFKRETLGVVTGSQPKMPLIFSAIRNVMRAIQPLAKTHLHEEGFDFRKIDELCAILQPLLVEHGVFYAPETLAKTEVERPVVLPDGTSFVNIFSTCTVRWHIYSAVDGSELPGPVITMGEGVSEQHFSTNAAQTMAEKAMLVKLFNIPIHGALDPEEATPESSQPSQSLGTPTPRQVSNEPQDATLFDVAPVTPTRRSKRKPLEPQTSVAGGAVAESLDAPAVVASGPLTPGFVKILQSQLKAKGLEEGKLFEHFKVESFDHMTKDQMGPATAFIQEA